MNHRKTECDAKCKQYTINAQYNISIDHPKKKLKGENCLKAKGDCPGRVTQIRWFSEQSGGETGVHKLWPNALKTNLNLKGNYQSQVHLDQTVFVIVRQ
jgi:hypothetical protein